MELPSDAIIAIEKMTDYLLQWRPENNGRMLRVASIWMTESATGQTKFITLYPAKEN